MKKANDINPAENRSLFLDVERIQFLGNGLVVLRFSAYFYRYHCISFRIAAQQFTNSTTFQSRPVTFVLASPGSYEKLRFVDFPSLYREALPLEPAAFLETVHEQIKASRDILMNQ